MSKQPSKPKELSPPEDWLAQHGDALYRYAYFRLRDAAQAEDLVQETLLAALQARHGFSGRSAERTWLIGILKNKLVDYLRKGAREQPFGDLADTEGEIDALFDAGGRWKTPPSDWGNPTNTLEQKQFWKVFADCFAGLSSRYAQVFAMCEFDGLDSTEVCKVFDVTATNVWVILHRARLRLRQCLETQWFGREAKK
jgi:RNA polymerase sigma-70 factor (ECF subfamily)